MISDHSSFTLWVPILRGNCFNFVLSGNPTVSMLVSWYQAINVTEVERNWSGIDSTLVEVTITSILERNVTGTKLS